MIDRIRIRGYRKYEDQYVLPKPGLNILVGDNESGKSTVVEAIMLGLTGRLNGRPIADELSPYIFNQDAVKRFFDARAKGNTPRLPEISIEIFFSDDATLASLSGANNSDLPTRTCPGVELVVVPNPDYVEEIESYLEAETAILPVEYYKAIWRTFADETLVARPRVLSTALIDSTTVRSSSGVDFHLRQMLSDHLDPKEKAQISVAYRSVKEQMTNEHLADVNIKMSALDASLDEQKLALAMDQSARSSWDANVSPHVSDLPFALAGLGQQVAIKIALAMGRTAGQARVIAIEEPENHLSHPNLARLVARIETLRASDQQVFITTHSSFVLNRLGLDGLLLVGKGAISSFKSLDDDTVDYFRKLPGYDTLRLVLARRVVLVEGPSDEIVFERFYRDTHNGHAPLEDGIDVLSMRGLSLARCFELASLLNIQCIALRDNDGENPIKLRELVESHLDGVNREVFIGEVADGATLEPQLVHANEESRLVEVLGITDRANLGTWMRNNKTEGALRILERPNFLNAPPYIAAAIAHLDA